jgi:tRNA A-37 threonylcarbamoyl transferase component Bud32/tetratricopeptide (TPR) repeat protein
VRETQIVADDVNRAAEDLGGLFGGHAAEIAHLDQVRQRALLARQGVDRQVQIEQTDRRQTSLRLDIDGRLQLQTPAAAPRARPRARVIDENPAHRLRDDGEEVRAIAEMHGRPAEQLQVGLVHQGGGLQGVIRPLFPQMRSGDAAKDHIHRIEQFGARRVVTRAEPIEQLRDGRLRFSGDGSHYSAEPIASMRDEVSAIFRDVADRTPAERTRYFEQYQVTPDLQAEVESLLAFDASDAPVMRLIAATAEEVLDSDGTPAEGSRCGPYRLMRLLGRGGTGDVFLAERVDGQVDQRVAIKLLRQRAFHQALRPSFQSRFLQERQILATLQHPGIARLLDAGETPEGRLYLALDYIDGSPIDQYAARLDLTGKLRLFLQVCDAVAYAHRNLIIHRDLKPSNILVSADGEPTLLDFGIAKILDAATMDQTRTQERVLTPEYASPEQIRGAAQSTATDIYSLGAVLYELLTGQSPHAFATRSPEGIDAAICTIDPAPASRLDPEVPRDLDYVLAKALRKEPEDRYSSVESMADDIRAFLEWRPVRARSGNAWYRTRKFMRRHRAVVSATMLTIAGLSVGLFIANRQRMIAEERFQQLRALSAQVFDLDARIRQLPGATEARHQLVSMSLEYLERLGASAHGDLDLAREIGAAYMRVARIQGVPTALNLGEVDKAGQSLEKADRFIDLVLASRPDDAAALDLSAGIAQDRMILAESQGRRDEGTKHAAKAAERLGRLLGSRQATPDQRYDAARYYANLALADINLHRYDEGQQYARQSIDAGRGLPSEQRLRAAGLSLIGSALRSQGRLDEALDALTQARHIAEGPIFASAVERAFDLYGILLREARTLGQDAGVSLGRTDDAIVVYQQCVDLMEDQASKDPRDQNARDRLATCSRELADLLEDKDPERSLAAFDLGIRRLREVPNNVRARRREAQALAESSYPLRRLHRLPEARQRIDAAFALLRDTHDYPATRLEPDSEVVSALRAQADDRADTGDPAAAVDIYEHLLDAMTAARGADPLNNLEDATKLSSLYAHLAGVYRRAGDAAKAEAMEDKRQALWRQWDDKLPHNAFIQRQRQPQENISR